MGLTLMHGPPGFVTAFYPEEKVKIIYTCVHLVQHLTRGSLSLLFGLLWISQHSDMKEKMAQRFFGLKLFRLSHGLKYVLGFDPPMSSSGAIQQIECKTISSLSS